MPAAVQLAGVTARDIRIEKIQNIGAVYNIPAATPAFSYRGIVGVPPPTDPKTIQQREKVVKEVYDRLTQPDITAIALTGIGGIGKSTLAALIYRYTEDQRQAGNGPFSAEPLWLTVNPAVTMADLAGTLIEALGKPMLDLGTLLPQNQAAALFNALNTVDKPRLVTLDQFENLLDWQTGQALPDRVGVGEWLDALNSQPCRCRVLLTSRLDPQGTREYPPTYLQTYPVEGLEEAEGIELLRKQGVTGTETELRTAVARCAGHAYALTLLASLLRTRKLSLSTLLKGLAYAELWSGKVAENLLDSIYKQLDELQRKLLTAFSVYREPVPLEAVQVVIDDTAKVPKAQVESSLDALLAQHLLQASGEGRYQLHVIVASYAQDHFVEGNEQANQQTLRAAHARAAPYYLQQAVTHCPPREQRRQISDVHDLIEAVWQYTQAAQWQEAYALVEQEQLVNDLFDWGGYAPLLDLCQWFLPLTEWQPEPQQAISIYMSLGYACKILGKKQEALEYLQQALIICREVGDRITEGTVLNDIGDIHTDLGNKQEALEYLQQALIICREVGNREGEGRTLNNIGRVHAELGHQQQALESLQQALTISREVGDRITEGATLSNIGSLHAELGHQQQALESLQQALTISKEVGDRRVEGGTLWSIGNLALGQHHYEFALAAYLLARQCFEEISSPWQNEVEDWIDDLRQEIGRKQFVVLRKRVEPQAQQFVEQAFQDWQAQHKEEE